jgi:hypothetical protein
MEDTERRELERRIRAKATSKARAKVGLRWHALVFVLVNVLLYAINMMFTPLVPWFIWPLGGWGIALALHAFATVSGPRVDEDAIEAEVQRELARRTASASR